MTEKQAWLTIAEAYGTPEEERSDEQRRMTRWGCCCGLRELWGLQNRGSACSIMLTKIRWDVDHYSRRNPFWDSYFCACIPANDKLRADYCYLQYYMLGGTR